MDPTLEVIVGRPRRRHATVAHAIFMGRIPLRMSQDRRLMCSSRTVRGDGTQQHESNPLEETMDPTLKTFMESQHPAGRWPDQDGRSRRPFRSTLNVRDTKLWPRWRFARELAAGGYVVRKDCNRVAYPRGAELPDSRPRPSPERLAAWQQTCMLPTARRLIGGPSRRATSIGQRMAIVGLSSILNFLREVSLRVCMRGGKSDPPSGRKCDRHS